MTAAGGTIKLGGRELIVCMPTFRDHGIIIAWVRENTPCPYKQAQEKLDKIAFMKELNPELWKERTEQYLLDAEEKFQKMETSVTLAEATIKKGWTFPVMMLIKTYQPDVTYEQVDEWLKKESGDNLVAIQGKVLELFTVPKSDPTAPAIKPES